MDVLTAAMHLVHDHPGGATALAPLLGKAASSLNHELSPRCEHAKLGLLDAVKLSVLTNDTRIAAAFAAELGCLLLPAPPADVGDPQAMQALAHLAREFGDVVGELGRSLADGRVCDNELVRVEREAGELLQALQGALALVRRLNAAGKPPAGGW